MSEAGCIVLIPSVAHNYNYIIFDNLNKFFFFNLEETKAFSGDKFRTNTLTRNTGFHLMDCFS